MTFAYFSLIFVFFISVQASPKPASSSSAKAASTSLIPDLSPYAIGLSTASVVPQNLGDKIEKNEGMNECVQKIATEIHQHLDNLGIRYRNFSSVVKDERKFNKMCREYITLKQGLNECTKPIGFIYKNGILTYLEIICRIKKDLILANRECIAEMEVAAGQSCQQACISQNYQGFDALVDPKNVELRCFVSSCISRCINDQIRECGESKTLGQLYNEIAGAQMLLGVEQIFVAGSKQTATFVQSDKVPASCRRLIWRSVLAASNLSSHPTTTPSIPNSPTVSF